MGEPRRIFLARHGETAWNAVRRVQGITDVPLNERGQRQGRELCRRFDRVPLDHVYTSALSRSVETAEELTRSVPSTRLKGLNEQSLGIFEGKYLRGENKDLADAFRLRRSDPDDTLDGGESLNQHRQRATEALQTIRGEHPGGQVLIVAHGGTNVLLVMSLLRLTYRRAMDFRMQNADVLAFELHLGGGDELRPLLFPLAAIDDLAGWTRLRDQLGSAVM